MDSSTLFETDVVVYRSTLVSDGDADEGLGVWLEGRIYPLEKEYVENSVHLVPTEGSTGFPPTSGIEIVGVLEHTMFEITARQINGGQGLGNPHGEHSEDVFIVGKEELEEEVEKIVGDGGEALG